MTINPFSGFTDKAPLSPSYFNGKMAEVYQSLNSLDQGGVVSTNVVYATNYNGADWGAKVGQALVALGPNGGTVDASGLTGSQSLSGTLTISTPRARILVGSMRLAMGSNSIQIPAGTNHVQIIGDQIAGGQDGTANDTYFQYTGNGSAFSVGGAGADTRFLRFQNISVDLQSAGSLAVALDLRRVQFYRVDDVRFQGASASQYSQIGVRMNGTGNFTGGIITNPLMFYVHGITMTGGSSANVIIGGSFSGATWHTGMSIDSTQNNGNTVLGTDFENFGTGVFCDYKWNNITGGRFESNTTDVQLGPNSAENWFNVSVFASASSWSDNGARNHVVATSPGDARFLFGGLVCGWGGTPTLPTFAPSSEKSLGWYRSAVSTMALSYGTFDLASGGVRLSMRTLAASAVTASAANTNVAAKEVVFTIGGASGASLAIHSGGTVYIFNSALSAKAT